MLPQDFIKGFYEGLIFTRKKIATKNTLFTQSCHKCPELPNVNNVPSRMLKDCEGTIELVDISAKLPGLQYIPIAKNTLFTKSCHKYPELPNVNNVL